MGVLGSFQISVRPILKTWWYQFLKTTNEIVGSKLGETNSQNSVVPIPENG